MLSAITKSKCRRHPTGCGTPFMATRRSVLNEAEASPREKHNPNRMREIRHVPDDLSLPVERRGSRRAIRQGLRFQISGWRSHLDTRDEAAAGRAIRRDRSWQDQG